ncbi:hypothetical protein BpHYR1_027314 [Brachionus plicatilis]|uniref:Uncharacterized protein n=1 Tax=Brachionus plicatilis TaxID=10195 RepID=A0A3M7SPH3_BRAPC|nr:hypothetical protein BpHYR1_027314 [Brachionus plicatilis]
MELSSPTDRRGQALTKIFTLTRLTVPLCRIIAASSSGLSSSSSDSESSSSDSSSSCFCSFNKFGMIRPKNVIIKVENHLKLMIFNNLLNCSREKK